jgi:predicted MFS family arabinose efflux permease
MSQQPVRLGKSTVRTPPYAWVILLAVYLASLAAPLNQFKVPPVMPILRDTFSLSYGSAGMLMSIFSIMGFVLAIPAGFILRRFGIKMTGLTAVGAVIVGSGLGALSHSSGSLFFGRFIEGAGMGLIMVAAPSAIALWFPAEKRGLPMGLWASCVGVGSIVTLNLGPVLAVSFGWRSVWWAGGGFALVAFVLFTVLFRLPRREELSEVRTAQDSEAGRMSLGKAMANPSLWMLSLSFLTFNLVIMAWSSFYPDFLNTVRNYSLANASFTTSLMMIIAIVSGPLGGYLSDRLGSRKILIVVPYVLLAAVFLFPFTIAGPSITALMILAGILLGPIAPVLLAAVPEIMVSPQLAGIGMGVAALGQNLGMFIGPALFGYLIGGMSWPAAGYMMIPICVVGIISAWLAKIR